MSVLCAKKSNSMLRETSIEELEKFSWNSLSEEVKSVAPTFYTILKGCTEVKCKKRNIQRKSNCVSDAVVFGCVWHLYWCSITTPEHSHECSLTYYLPSVTQWSQWKTGINCGNSIVNVYCCIKCQVFCFSLH